jgi:hypothetical protein
MPNKKTSQLPLKSSNLLATDLLEVSEVNNGGYTSKKINGQQIVDGVLSNISAPTLDSVAANGNITSYSIISNDSSSLSSSLSPGLVSSVSLDPDKYIKLDALNGLEIKTGSFESVLRNNNVGNSNLVLEFPNKTAGSYTLSTTDDLIDNRISEVFRGFTFNNNSTTVVTDGGLTASPTASTLAQSVASTNFASKQVRLRYYASAISTGRYTGLRGSSLLWFIGGGFKFVCDFNISDTAFGSACQQFYGLAGQTTDLNYGGVSQTLVNTLTNIIGVGSENGDANLQVFYNDASGIATKIDLGSSFPSNRDASNIMTTVYSVILYNAPGSSSVIYRVINNETGAVARGTIATNLPLHTQGLNIFATRVMGAAVTNTGQFDLMKLGCYSLL